MTTKTDTEENIPEAHRVDPWVCDECDKAIQKENEEYEKRRREAPVSVVYRDLEHHQKRWEGMSEETRKIVTCCPWDNTTTTKEEWMASRVGWYIECDFYLGWDGPHKTSEDAWKVVREAQKEPA